MKGEDIFNLTKNLGTVLQYSHTVRNVAATLEDCHHFKCRLQVVCQFESLSVDYVYNV